MQIGPESKSIDKKKRKARQIDKMSSNKKKTEKTRILKKHRNKNQKINL